jgi:hypothetical protein
MIYLLKESVKSVKLVLAISFASILESVGSQREYHSIPTLFFTVIQYLQNRLESSSQNLL